MSDIEKTRQEALQIIEDCSREMQEAMRIEKPELAAAFGAMATTAGIAFLLGRHKPSDAERDYADARRMQGKVIALTHELNTAREIMQQTLTDAARDVLAERRRQVEAEGWTPEHDDRHFNGEMAVAAACYADPVTGYLDPRISVPRRWPWLRSWWKPKDRRSNLVRAAALLLAEIERIDRAAARATKGGFRG